MVPKQIFEAIRLLIFHQAMNISDFVLQVQEKI